MVFRFSGDGPPTDPATTNRCGPTQTRPPPRRAIPARRGTQDAFRAQHPEASGCFSYWSVRAGNRPYNRGLRLDYSVASKRLLEPAAEPGALRVADAFILGEDTVGVSDHSPVGLVLTGF